MKPFDLTGKVVILGASSGGMGRGIAKVFAKSGAQIIITGRNIEKIKSVSDSICSNGGLSDYHQLDLYEESSVIALMADVYDKYGRLDGLVGIRAASPLTPSATSTFPMSPPNASASRCTRPTAGTSAPSARPAGGTRASSTLRPCPTRFRSASTSVGCCGSPRARSVPSVETIIEVMAQIKEKNLELPHQLLISGVNGESRSRLEQQIRLRGLEKEVMLTGFVENKERNSLYKYCQAFLFPSVFEGFGMPMIEAMLFGTMVVTTKKSCIPEISQGKANYVSDPYDVDEWIRVMQNLQDHIKEVDFTRYDQKILTEKYYKLLSEQLS